MDNSPVITETDGLCLNCGAALTGIYCAKCGQQAKEFRRPFFKLTGEAIQSLFELDGRAFRTLFYLLTKPAHLTREYFSGRRTRYTPPLRLFLVISVSFFLLVSFYASIRSMEGMLNADTEITNEESPAASDQALDVSFDSDIENGSDGLDAILAFVEIINLPFFDAQTNANLRRAMGEQAESNLNALLEDPNEFGRGYLEYITFFMLLMIPLLALLQKIVYIRQGHYYVEHLVLTLHNHAFVISIMFVTGVTGLIEESQIPIANYLFGFLGSAIYIWMWVYLFLSLKNYFQQGYGITLLKYITTTILYGVVLGLGIFFFAGALFFLA
ncbi:MAG: hypothetical protein DHS20C12_18940 [Pseudohongiella sp.]|nr:MAG: hypothetical protein DHS20C12_18940 [Pseudohongiella sp.]